MDDMDIDSPKEQSQKKAVKRDQKKHRLVLQGAIPHGLKVSYISKGEGLLTGRTMGSGIFCDCCENVVSPTMFESHAGRSACRKPYQHIFLSNGMSLHQYASSLKLNRGKMVEGDVLPCMVCQKSGDLLFCESDGCNRSFHKECIPESSGTSKSSDTNITLKKRFCPRCQNTTKSTVSKANAVKTGRVSRVDSIEGIARQCLQPIACAICRSCDFAEHGFSEKTSIICDQCEIEYHIGCLRRYANIVLTERPLEDWFCTKDCEDLHSLLKDMVEWGPLIVDGSDPESITNHSNLDLRWFVLSGNYVCQDYRCLLVKAVDIFHDCFSPIIDPVTGEDFIPSMAYGLKVDRFNFSGVYTVFIEANFEVVTAGMLRVFGREVAELSIVATSRPYQGQGYLHCFFICLEKLLSQLQVKKLVIPAAADTKAMWIKKFGFRKLNPETLAEYTEIHTARVALRGTTLLERKIRQGLKKLRRWRQPGF